MTLIHHIKQARSSSVGRSTDYAYFIQWFTMLAFLKDYYHVKIKENKSKDSYTNRCVKIIT